MRKGILLFGNHPPPFGGVPTHIQYLCSYLVEKGWDVHVLSKEGNKTLSLDYVIYKNGYTIYRPSKFLIGLKLLFSNYDIQERPILKSFATRLPNTFLGNLGLAKLVKEIVIKNHVKIISAYHIFSAGIVSAMVCRELSLPLVITVFGEIYSQPDFYKRHLKQVKYVIDTSRRILSCSKHCANSFKLLGLSPHTEFVYYGIDINKFSPNNNGAILRARFGIKDKDRVAIFVGRMEKEMGLHVLLESIPHVLKVRHGMKFIIVGKRGELLESASSLARKYKRNVFVLSDVPSEELPLYYAAASFTVVPSINERACLGLAIAEAMATAKPMIVSNIGGGLEVISEDGAIGILIIPQDVSSLTQAIIKMVDFDEDIIRDMGRRGRDRAVEIFDKDKTNNKMEQIFSECIEYTSANNMRKLYRP